MHRGSLPLFAVPRRQPQRLLPRLAPVVTPCQLPVHEGSNKRWTEEHAHLTLAGGQVAPLNKLLQPKPCVSRFVANGYQLPLRQASLTCIPLSTRMNSPGRQGDWPASTCKARSSSNNCSTEMPRVLPLKRTPYAGLLRCVHAVSRSAWSAKLAAFVSSTAAQEADRIWASRARTTVSTCYCASAGR